MNNNEFGSHCTTIKKPQYKSCAVALCDCPATECTLTSGEIGFLMIQNIAKCQRTFPDVNSPRSGSHVVKTFTLDEFPFPSIKANVRMEIIY